MRKKLVDNKAVREALLELEGSRANGQLAEPARFHPFPARMPVSVVQHLISRITISGAKILDPMAGSGTTLVAAKYVQRQSIGFDRDPLAILISRTATSDFEAETLARMQLRILDRAQKTLNSAKIQLKSLRAKMSPEDQEFLDYWFPPESQQQLAKLATSIQQEANGKEKDFAWVVFSSLIIAKSAGASYALDLPRSRPHRCFEKSIYLPFEAWPKRFHAAVRRLPFINKQQTTDALVSLGDARNLPLKNDSIDLVITSPPYINAIDYLRAHKFSLVWMGYNLHDLRELRGTMVGSERGLFGLDGLPKKLEERLNRLRKDTRDRAIRRRYLSDLTKVISEINRVLQPGGLALLTVGPTMISLKRTDAAKVLTSIGQSCGLEFIESVTRDLKASHRSLPIPRATTANPLANRMRREVIVAFRK